jgi:hypothetical protein
LRFPMPNLRQFAADNQLSTGWPRQKNNSCRKITGFSD